MKHLGKQLTRRPVTAVAASALALTLTAAAPATTAAAFGATGQGNGGGTPVVAKTDQGKLISHVFGTTDDGRRVGGTFTPQSFQVVGDQLMATGVLDGVIRGHGAPQRFSETVTMPVKSVNGSLAGLAGGGKGLAGTAAAGACDVLNLVLGPLDLDVLGLQVHLDKVVLDVVAQSGAGNLLGNLLCSVAGLLDGGSPLSGLLGQVSDLLNQILGALNLGL